MKIAVCLKRVPDTEMRFAIAADGKSVDTVGLKFEISTFDEYAVEAALQLNEAHAPGEVAVVGLGPDGLGEHLRKALAMGADRAIHLAAETVPYDALAIARSLAGALKEQGFDLILFGRNATDTGSGAVGPMVAELLGLPCVTAVSHLEISGATGTARRELEGATATITFPLPAVLTIDEGIARPRIAGLKGIMAAKKKPMEVRPAELGAEVLSIDRLALPPERQAGRIVGEGADAVPELVRLLHDEAKAL
ncbi:MAG: electron transfer flavoprotein subunit beta/FixA family protein [Gemmatimonadota bacterium]|nr:electron transfer flavoprotein subunit beta/FixA family protein [Gemmatimonadota bacterium]